MTPKHSFILLPKRVPNKVSMGQYPGTVLSAAKGNIPFRKKFPVQLVEIPTERKNKAEFFLEQTDKLGMYV